MRYASVRSLDISNGENLGVSLFVQGCHFHCFNCFNPETWDFNGGKEWTQEVEDKFLELASKPHIKRISILGGDPLAEKNLEGVLNLVNKIRILYPDKTIWLYTGYTWDEIWQATIDTPAKLKRRAIVNLIDVLVDGRYIDSQRDITKKWRGSKNQRVIDVQQSLLTDKVILHCD